MAVIKNIIKRAPLDKKEIVRCLNDFVYFCERCILITDKNGKKIPFRLNQAQKIFAKFLERNVFTRNPKPKTLVILKARQMGYTTVLLAMELYIMIKFNNNEYDALNMKHFLHLGSMVDEIRSDKMKPMIENLHPTFFGVFHENKKENMFHITDFKKQRRNNKIRYYTARSEQSGRGGTAQLVCLDEVAFYPNLGKIQEGAVSSLPSSGLSLLIYCSTANGFNGFYDMVQLAKADSSPDMEYLFLPWFLMEEYIADPRGVKVESLTDHEKKIIEEMKKWKIEKHLFLPKIAWYRNQLIEKKGNDLKAMKQEYPTTDDEPFTSSDAPVFPADKVLSALKQADTPETYVMNTIGQKIVETGKHWDIKVFAKPQVGVRYMLVVDPAFGGELADNTSIRVMNQRTLSDCAVYTTKSETEDVAELIVALAKWYNYATINVERNAGALMISTIRGLRYSNFWRDNTVKINRDNIDKNVGTRITKTTRDLGIERLRFMLSTGMYVPKDEDTLQELLHFNYVGTGSSRKAQACGTKPDGTPYHDDLVMGLVNWALTLPKTMFRVIEQNDKR